MRTTKLDNDAWIKDNFESIIRRYGGRFPYILVAGQRVFPVKEGSDIPRLERRLKRKYGQAIGMPVPQPKDFTSILIFFRL